MRTGLYTLAELFGNRHIAQLVIPEIQRDYVWGPQQVTHLFNSIQENFLGWQQELTTPSLKIVTSHSGNNVRLNGAELESLEAGFTDFHARRHYSTNVGFVYAYSDQDLDGQFFLIDGQQRLTTLYLMLLAVATSDNELRDRFQARYCLSHQAEESKQTNARPRLDYRLREQTAHFLHQWIQYLLNGETNTSPAKDQAWYLKKLNEDTTVRNLLSNYTTIQERLRTEVKDSQVSSFYDYLENLVQCWYFDTNESAQGEELYLYLNARGESIADNENLKANLLSSLSAQEDKEKWGRTWEDWQDYFWQKRHVGLPKEQANVNADRGFNSFLTCIESLEKLRKKHTDDANSITLELIHRYVGILHWLEDHKEEFKAAYSYAKWVDNWYAELWNLFNNAGATEWSANLSDSKKSTAHNRMVLTWGSLLCVQLSIEEADNNLDNVEPIEVFRAIRFIYLRYHNYSRAVSSLAEVIAGLLGHKLTTFSDLRSVTDEERSKWLYLADTPAPERIKLEEVIWEIEDHPLNLNGRDLGATNHSYLIELDEDATLERLISVRDTFYELLPPKETSSSYKRVEIASALLSYGSFWNRVSPWYYNNYDLGNWRRTIRGLGSEENSSDKATFFRQFFDEFIKANQPLDAFIQAKQISQQVEPEIEQDLRKALIWYSDELGSKFLCKGMYVAISYGELERDSSFPELPTIWNTQGDFKGNRGNAKMSDQL